MSNDRVCYEKHTKLHLNRKDFSCFYCDYRAVTRSHVITHIRRVHNGHKTYACDRCSFTTAYPLSLRYHLMGHLGLKPFSCPYCNFRAVQKMKVVYHIQTKHRGLNTNHIPEVDVNLNIDLSKYKIACGAAQREQNGVLQITTDACQTASTVTGADAIGGVILDCNGSQTSAVTSFDDDMSGIDCFAAVDNLLPSHSTAELLESASRMRSLLAEGLQFTITQDSESGEPIVNTQNHVIKDERNVVSIVDSDLTSNLSHSDDVTYVPGVASSSDVSLEPDITLDCTAFALSNGYLSGHSDSVLVLENETETETRKSLAYQCSACDFTDTCYDVLSSHVLLHNGIRLYQCPLCGHTSQKYDDIQVHCAHHHADVSHVTINEINMSLESASVTNDLTAQAQQQHGPEVDVLAPSLLNDAVA